MARTNRSPASRRRLLLAGVSALVLVGLAYWLWPRPAAAPAGGLGTPGFAVAVEGTPATQGPLAENLTVVGQVEASQGVALKSEIAGRVRDILFKDGTLVKKGDLLFRLDDSVQMAAVAQARANLQLSINNSGRVSRLSAEGASSRQEVDTAEAELMLARANVQYAEAQLAKARIVAPFDGVVGIRQVNPGDYIVAGNTLVYVTENNRLKVTFRLPENAAANLQIGTPVTIRGEEGQEITAPVGALDSQVDPATRTREVQVLLDNAGDVLVAGQFIRVTAPVRQVTGAVLVPTQALVPSGSKMFAYVINRLPQEENGMPAGTTLSSRTEVVVGLRGPNQVQITAGVQAGQMVVTAGHQKLQAPVMPVRVLSPTVINVRPAPVETLPEVGGGRAVADPSATQAAPQAAQ